MNDTSLIIARLVVIALGGLGGWLLWRLKQRLGDEDLDMLIADFVAAAEQAYKGKIDTTGAARHTYVVEHLRAAGVECITEDIKARIEAAVYRLNFQQSAAKVEEFSHKNGG